MPEIEQPPAKPFILVIEENPEQVLVIQNAFQEDAMGCRVEAIADGIEASRFLQGCRNRTPSRQNSGETLQENRQVEFPNLILLNLNLPGKSGREILEELKSSADLRRIPVVILTDSDDEEDIFQSYAQRGNSYVIKSSDRDRLYQIVRRIKEFWLGIVTLPLG